MKIPSKTPQFLLIGLLALFAFAVLVYAAAVTNSPTACSGQWTNCANAFADNTARATASATGNSNKTGTWNNYGFSIANSSGIDSVRVRADFFASNVRGYIDVRVSGDGGLTFGPNHVVGGNTAEQTFWIDVTGDLGWTASKLSNANLRVNATCFKQGSGSNPTCRLDWLPVEVTYTPFDFSVSANPSSGVVTQGGSNQTTVSVNLLGGISQNVALSYTGCPTAATCSFNPSSGTPSYTSTFTVATSVSTPTGTYPINITGTGDGKVRNATYTLTVQAAPPVCTRGYPVVSITPENKNGTAGSTLVYVTNVANTDAAGCEAATFNMSAVVPSGWSGVFDSNQLLIDPGNSKATNFSVTSALDAAPGSYNFTNTAVNTASLLNHTDTAIYLVIS